MFHFYKKKWVRFRMTFFSVKLKTSSFEHLNRATLERRHELLFAFEAFVRYRAQITALNSKL